MKTKEFFTKWITALRSGDYKQTEGALYSETEDAFCALGVGCMVATNNMHPMNLYGFTHPEDVGDLIKTDSNIEILYKPFFDTIKNHDDSRTHHINMAFFDEIVQRNDETNQNLHDLADYIEYEYAKDILG